MKAKKIKLNKEQKVMVNTLIEILIFEIREALPDIESVNKVLDSWITGNDLHVETVGTMTLEEAKKFFKQQYDLELVE